MADNSNKHIQVYRDHFGDDWLPCEVCGSTLSDIHHVEYRSKFGIKKADEQDSLQNLIGLCRFCHEKAHSGKLTKEYLFSIIAGRA